MQKKMFSISLAKKNCNSCRENSSFKLLCHFIAWKKNGKMERKGMEEWKKSVHVNQK